MLLRRYSSEARESFRSSCPEHAAFSNFKPWRELQREENNFTNYLRGAGTSRANIARHGGVEGISADDVVDVCGGDHVRLDNGVNALDGQR